VVLAARAAGARVAVDASGEALAAAVRSGPDLIKPNRRELEEAVGRPVRTLADAVDAAEELRQLGAGEVLASLGPEGALLVGEDGVLHAESPVSRVRSTVGAGDTLLAGFLAGDGGAFGLRNGVGWACESVAQPGTSLLAPPEHAAPVVLVREDFDRNRLLDGPGEGDAGLVAAGSQTTDIAVQEERE
jgi:1-phosphofructokinase